MVVRATCCLTADNNHSASRTTKLVPLRTRLIRFPPAFTALSTDAAANLGSGGSITEMLLAASSAILKSGLGGDGHGGRRSAEEVGAVALQTAHDLLVGVAFSSAAGDVGLGGEQQRIRVTAMVWMARLRARSAPRLSR